jgi:hypothetical protein
MSQGVKNQGRLKKAWGRSSLKHQIALQSELVTQSRLSFSKKGAAPIAAKFQSPKPYTALGASTFFDAKPQRSLLRQKQGRLGSSSVTPKPSAGPKKRARTAEVTISCDKKARKDRLSRFVQNNLEPWEQDVGSEEAEWEDPSMVEVPDFVKRPPKKQQMRLASLLKPRQSQLKRYALG